MSGKFITTTKDVGLLYQLYIDEQLRLDPEFQRNSIWPRQARAYLIDTILEEQPIPVLYLQRQFSAQLNRQVYSVIDGQQRLRSLFMFIENRVRLTQSDSSSPWHNARWKTLDPTYREQLMNYSFTVYEMSGYSDDEIRDMFRRMNRYVMALNPQEFRHSSAPGQFKELVEDIGALDFWTVNGIVTPNAHLRMKNDELAAELLILINEGAQDKKESIDFYYSNYRDDFPGASGLKEELLDIFNQISLIFPDLSQTEWKKPANLYALVGALSDIGNDEEVALPDLSEVRSRLDNFSHDLTAPEENKSVLALDYAAAASRQTDNIKPRTTRISGLRSVILDQPWKP